MKASNPKFSAWSPPRHRGCRSALSYDVDDRYKLDEDSTKRASSFTVDGLRDPKPVSSKGIYYDKMRSLSAADQDKIMGVTLGKAFRAGLKDGTLTPESFAKMTVDSLYQPLNVAQMSARNNALGDVLRKQSGSKKKSRTPAKKPKVSDKTEASISSVKKANSSVPTGTIELQGSKIAGKNGSPVIKKAITADEAAYIDYYKADGFYDSNKILRNPSKHSKAEIDNAKLMQKSINDAISKSEIDGDMVVYRGLRGGDAFNGIDDSSIGKVISLDTIQSTSTDARVALNYSGAVKVGGDYFSADSGSTIFKIRLKKGQNALDADGLTGINTSEKEMLLSSNGSYTVNSVETRTDNTGKVVLKIVNVDYKG